MVPAETKAFGQGDERMERKMSTGGTEKDEPAMNEAVEHTGTVSPETGRRVRRWLRLGAGLRFTRHLLEMLIAMFAGMGLFYVALMLLGEPPGYDAHPLVEYGLMGPFMAAPMVAWMRYRRHSWRDGGEMTAAMLVSMLAMVLPVQLGVAISGLSEGSLMTLSHVAMIGGMIALMIYRRDRYAHGAHGHSP
jgi:hypothetical protein